MSEPIDPIDEADEADGYPPEDTEDVDLGVSDDNWACGTLDPET